MPRADQFTATEAAFVLREPVRAVRKALDSGPVQSSLRRRGEAAVRTIGWPDLLYLFAVKVLREELTPKARTEFYTALQHAGVERNGEVRFGRYRIAVGDMVREVEQRTGELARLADRVAFRADGEAVLRGLDIEVYRIAALLDGGMSESDVLGDYPTLTASAIETVRAYAASHPKSGRPYPQITAKRALLGAGLEALDEVPEDTRA